MLKLRTYALALLFGLATVPVAWGQGSQGQNSPAQEPTAPAQPLPPDKSSDNPGKPNPDGQPVSPIVAGNVSDAPLTGAAMPIIGLVSSRSYVVPSLLFYGQLDSNANNTAGNYHFASINTLMGSLAVQKLGRVSQLNFDYLIGRSFSSQGNAFNSTTHDLTVSDLWSRGRWDGFIVEKLLYSSESAFLGGAVPFNIIGLDTVAGLAATGPIILRNSFLPGQGIFTNFGPRLSNATVAQVNNHLSRRTFFTVVGNYNTLRFFNSSLINTSAAGFQTGLGYQRTREETIAVVYRFNDLWFTALPISIRDHIIELTYERRLGQRLLFQVGAGPEISLIHDTALIGATPGAPLFSDSRVSWTADASLQYRLRRVAFLGGYDHYVTSGSGVFLGAITDRAHFGYSRQLSRVWDLNASASFAHNVNLVPLFTPTQNVPANASYNSVYAGVELLRRVGRDSELFFGYLGRYQTASYAVCPTGICQGTNLAGHQLNLGFAWRLKPFPID
jgi:hypothetical protein